MRYTFIGNKQTDDSYRGMQCDPVRRPDGKCIVNMKLASALVVDDKGKRHVVPRRFLRLNSKIESELKMNTQDVYETIVDTLTTLKTGIEDDYTGIDSLWDADAFQAYCNEVGAKRTDVIEALLVSIDRHIASIPEPGAGTDDEDKYKTEELPQVVTPVNAPELSEIIPIDKIIDDSQYLGNQYRPSGQYRVMKCIAVRNTTMLRLGFDINPYNVGNPDSKQSPWIQYYPVEDCLLVDAEQERAA
ncbi:MAG: hypothetical protein ACPG7F_11070 [Aggregatilineales bacterium]